MQEQGTEIWLGTKDLHRSPLIQRSNSRGLFLSALLLFDLFTGSVAHKPPHCFSGRNPPYTSTTRLHTYSHLQNIHELCGIPEWTVDEKDKKIGHVYLYFVFMCIGFCNVLI